MTARTRFDYRRRGLRNAIDNPRAEPARLRLAARVCTGRPEPAAFSIRSADLDYSTQATSACVAVDLERCTSCCDFRFAAEDGDVLQNM